MMREEKNILKKMLKRMGANELMGISRNKGKYIVKRNGLLLCQNIGRRDKNTATPLIRLSGVAVE